MEVINSTKILEKMKSLNPKRRYLAMFSSLWGGVTFDPEWMMIPIDDHLVHRGDGVFEAVRVAKRSGYLAKEHLDRLVRSAEMVDLKGVPPKEQIHKYCDDIVALVRDQGFTGELMLRIFVGRGPGDFSPNPYSTVGTQLYIVATPFTPMALEYYSRGVSVMISKIPAKPTPFSQVKSCNYLPNVLMKKESVDNGYDFAVGVNEEGYVAEGPTENILILNQKNELVAPRFDYTLRGTTLVRTMKLAEKLSFQNIRVDDLQVESLLNAKEVMMVGTTLGVLPVSRIEKKQITDGAGPVAQQLHALIMQDMNL